jgi:hypothetical protein
MDIEPQNGGYQVFIMPMVVPTIKLAIPGVSQSVDWSVHTLDPQPARDVLDFGSEMKIMQAAFHISAPGSRFSRDGWKNTSDAMGENLEVDEAKE